MDADSSYGGSDTAQDSHSTHDHNSSLEDPVTHIPTSNDNHDNSFYHKNEITLPVNYENSDEPDFQPSNLTKSNSSNNIVKAPHYMSTANLNINDTLEHHSNLEEMSKNYKSTQYLNSPSPDLRRGHKSEGVDNPAFDQEGAEGEKSEQSDKKIKSTFDNTRPYSGDLNSSAALGLTSPGSFKQKSKNGKPHPEENMAEAVNLELINLKPTDSKDVTGAYEINGTTSTNGTGNKNGISGIPVKKENEAEVGNPYDEYFVPVNEHRKYMSKTRKGRNSVTFAEMIATTGGVDNSTGLSVTTPEEGIVEYPQWLTSLENRGEKLYVTMDKRNKKKRNKCLCWGICLGIVAAAVIIGILAAVGVIGNQGPHPVKEVSARHFGSAPISTSNSNETQPEVKAGSVFGLSPSDVSSSEPPLTPGPPLSTVPAILPSTETSMIEVPRALESRFVIDNLQFSPALSDRNSSEFKSLAESLENELKSSLFPANVLKYGAADVQVKVMDFTPGSVVVKYRITWTFKDGIHNAKDPMTKEMLESKLQQVVAKNGGYLESYHIQGSTVEAEKIIDLCKIGNNDCQHDCNFDYSKSDFICSCPQGQHLNLDEKTCSMDDPQLPHGPTFEIASPSHEHTSPEPEPTSVEPLMEHVHHEPEQVQPLPEPTSVEPEMEHVQPEPEPTSVEPEMEHVHHEHQQVQPEPEPTSVEPEMEHLGVEHQQVQPEPEPTSVEPSTEHNHHEQAQPEPEPTSVEPETEHVHHDHEYVKPEPTSEPEPKAEPTTTTEKSISHENYVHLQQVPVTSEPQSEPDAVVPLAQPTAEPTAEPTPEPSAEPDVKLVVVHTTHEPSAEPAAEPTTVEPVAEPGLKHMDEHTTREPTAEPTAEHESNGVELVVEHHTTHEPFAEPTAEPSAEHEPKAEPTTHEPSAEPTAEPNPDHEPKAEPTADHEPKAEPTTHEPSAEPTAEPGADHEPKAEPTAEPIADHEPKAEPTTHEPKAEPTTHEPIAEPTAEPSAANEPKLSEHTTQEPNAEPTVEPESKGVEHNIRLVAEHSTDEPAAEPTAEPAALSEEPTTTETRSSEQDKTEDKINVISSAEITTSSTTPESRHQSLEHEILAEPELTTLTSDVMTTIKPIVMVTNNESATETVVQTTTNQTHQNMNAMQDSTENASALDNMSPFLPELYNNDTFVKKLHLGEHILQNETRDDESETMITSAISTTANPPRLDNDEKNVTNPHDPNPSDVTVLSVVPLENGGTTTLASNGEVVTKVPLFETTLPPEIINNIHSNSFFEQILSSTTTTTTTTTEKIQSNGSTSSAEDLIAMETTTNAMLNESNNTSGGTTIHAEIVDTATESVRFTDNGTTIKNMEENKTEESATAPVQLSDNNLHEYEVKETVADFTTTERLFLSALATTKGTTTTSTEKPPQTIFFKEDEDLSVEPLNSADEHRQSEDHFNKIGDSNEAANDISEEEEKSVLDKFKSEFKSNNEEIDTTTVRFDDNAEKYKSDKSGSKKSYFEKKNKSKFESVKPVTEGFSIEGLQRCSNGEFQCTNGTSVKDGKYCIAEGDRCDAVTDCSDGSDEDGCEEKNCLSNFKCSSGQCLKRHLVCDGIQNCNDGSDEVSCDQWTCLPEVEFSCNNRCLPLSWKCDGKKHCPDGSDEHNCPLNECSNDEPDYFKCTEQNICIPKTWHCDGKSDCQNSEDEKSCTCRNDQFKCKLGGGCIALNQKCDGIAQCADKSDEWNCLTLGDDRAKYLQIEASNGTWYPVCSGNWSQSHSDSVCQSLGYSGSVSTENVTRGEANATEYYTIKSDDGNTNNNKSILGHLELRSSCESFLSITCQEFTCGNYDSTHTESDRSPRIVGGNTGAETQWPSLTLLFDKKNNLQCTATLISPLWVVASYACIYGDNTSRPHDWLLYAGSTNFFISEDNSTTQVQKVDALVPHPHAKFDQFEYRDDVVLARLEKPLTLSTNVSTVCLPENDIEPRQLCVIAGWGVSKPGESNKNPYLHYLPVPVMDSDECNSTKHYNGLVSTDKICAGYTDPEKTPCYNDEGAPLMCFSNSASIWELQGVLSHHDNCAKGKHPALYTSINSKTRQWVIDTIGQNPKRGV